MLSSTTSSEFLYNEMKIVTKSCKANRSLLFLHQQTAFEKIMMEGSRYKPTIRQAKSRRLNINITSIQVPLENGSKSSIIDDSRPDRVRCEVVTKVIRPYWFDWWHHLDSSKLSSTFLCCHHSLMSEHTQRAQWT